VVVKNTKLKRDTWIWFLKLVQISSVHLKKLLNILCVSVLTYKMIIIIFPNFIGLWK
jgi:hypothetical protein